MTWVEMCGYKNGNERCGREGAVTIDGVKRAEVLLFSLSLFFQIPIQLQSEAAKAAEGSEAHANADTHTRGPRKCTSGQTK